MVDLLLDEVNQDVRRERLYAFLRRWRKPIIYAALALIVGTAGSSIRDHYRIQAAQRAMAGLATARAAFAAKNFSVAAEQFAALAAAQNGDVRDMALLWQARSVLALKKPAEADALLVRLAESPAGDDRLWRDLACIERAARAPMPAPCTRADASPLQSQRLELHASELIAQGKREDAMVLLKTMLADDAMTSTARTRVQALLHAAQNVP